MSPFSNIRHMGQTYCLVFLRLLTGSHSFFSFQGKSSFPCYFLLSCYRGFSSPRPTTTCFISPFWQSFRTIHHKSLKHHPLRVSTNLSPQHFQVCISSTTRFPISISFCLFFQLSQPSLYDPFLFNNLF